MEAKSVAELPAGIGSTNRNGQPRCLVFRDGKHASLFSTHQEPI
jgi:hypothetical protein